MDTEYWLAGRAPRRVGGWRKLWLASAAFAVVVSSAPLSGAEGGEIGRALDDCAAAVASSEDGFAPGAVWLRESKNGGYATPAIGARDNLIVLDTSPSMRSPDTGLIRPSVVGRLEVMLLAMKEARRIRILDASGRLIAAWPIGGRLSSGPAERADLEALARRVAAYLPSSESRFDKGLLAAAKMVRRDHAAIFVAGDEYTGRVEDAAALTRRLDRFLKARAATLSFFKVHDFIIDASRPRTGAAPDFDRQQSPKRFNSIAAFLASRYGGKVYAFQSFDRTPAISAAEELILLKLIEHRPSERWAVDAATVDVGLINELLERKGQPKVLAARDSEESADRPLLELEAERIGEGRAFCYVTARAASGEAVAEYRALVALGNRGWNLEEWLTVFEIPDE